MTLTSYTFSELEEERWQQFKIHHLINRQCHNPSNNYYYEIHPTSCGSVLYAVCPFCGEKKDISDYDRW